MTYKKASIIGLLGLILAVSSPVSALAHVNVEAGKINYAPNVSSWTQYGNADVYSDGRAIITHDSHQDGHVYTDVNIPSSAEGDYAVFVSFTRAEKPYSNYSDGGENISGLPSLSAYFLDDDDKIVEYMTNISSMRQKSSNGTSWHVSYGIVDVPNDSESMRLFLQQASSSLTTADGRAAWFYKPGLYFVDSKNDASAIVSAYRSKLGEVADEFDGDIINVVYDDNDDTDYPVGTLLGCSKEADVYSMTSSNTLKLFPNEDTFYAWGNSFSDVKKISCDKLDDYSVSGTWTYTRASYLVKFHGQPGVFTLDNGKYLRLIPNEYTAYKMYGSHWTSLIREYSVDDMGDFSYSVPHKSLK